MIENKHTHIHETRKENVIDLVVGEDEANMRLDRFLKWMTPPSATMSHSWLCMSLRKKTN